MKGKSLVAGLLLLVSGIAIAATFYINGQYDPSNWPLNQALVNIDQTAYAFATLSTAEQRKKAHKMVFTNSWYSFYKIVCVPPYCTAPWLEVPGSAVNTGSTGGGGYCGPVVAEGDPCYISPIVIDLGKDGFEFGPKGRFVSFDLTGDGAPDHVQWTAPGGDEAFVVRDLNGNDVVDSGLELFGDQVDANGFDALAKLDANEDGVVDEKEGRELLLWNDVNADAVTDPGELVPLNGMRLPTTAQARPEIYMNGNWVPLWAQIRPGLAMVDVWFATK